MIHPSYTELLKVVNAESEGDTPAVNSRYSIVMAAAKRARQIISGDADVTVSEAKKPLSTAVEELYTGRVRIVSAEDPADDEKLMVSDTSYHFSDGSDDGSEAADEDAAEYEGGDDEEYDDGKEDEDDEDDDEDGE